MAIGTPTSPKPRVVLAHDWLVARRGGESVLSAIARALAPSSDLCRLYTMFDQGVRLSPEIDELPRRVSLLQQLPFAASLRRWLLPAYHACVAELSQRLEREHQRRPIDLVVSTSSAAMLGLTAPPDVPHVCYLHTPARYIWTQAGAYGQASGLQGFALDLFARTLQDLDREASRSVSGFIANSAHTALLARSCYARSAAVVHPPVRTGFFTPGDGRREGFWLAAGALEPYKRFDLAIEAARLASRELVIVGRGTCLPALRACAGPNVRFVSDASDEEVRDLMRRARLLLFPQVEDFGIIAVEAQACGLPVVATRAGGALETVIEGFTGAFAESDSAEALAAAATERCPSPDEPRIRANAERFGESRFAREFLGAISGFTASRRAR